MLKKLQIILLFKIYNNKLYLYLNFFFKVPMVTLINYYYSKRLFVYLSFSMVQHLLWLVSTAVWLFLTPFGIQPHWMLLKYKCGGLLLTQII